MHLLTQEERFTDRVIVFLFLKNCSESIILTLIWNHQDIFASTTNVSGKLYFLFNYSESVHYIHFNQKTMWSADQVMQVLSWSSRKNSNEWCSFVYIRKLKHTFYFFLSSFILTVSSPAFKPESENHRIQISRNFLS